MDKLRDANFVANLLGGIFILVAILGFVPNPLVGPNGLFMTNAMHNIVHALLGIVLLAGAKTGNAQKMLLVVGVVYLLVAILGYFTPGDMLLGMVMVNPADHYLHLLLAVVLLGASQYVGGGKKR